MTKKSATHITIVLDRSGSMSQVHADAIGGFNTFLEQQQKLPDEATLTLVQFDHAYDVVHRAVDVRRIPALTADTYIPRGQTALYDAVGRAAAETEEWIHALPKAERPAKVIVAILTDGEENASREYTHKKVQKLIESKKKAGWDFLFLGANMNVVTVGATMGIDAASSVAFDADAAGTRGAFAVMSERVAASRQSRR